MSDGPNCKDVCAWHEDRNKVIETIEEEIKDSIGPTINQHKAYWKFFFWGAAAVFIFVSYQVTEIKSSTESINEAVKRMEQSVAIGQVNHRNNVMRLSNIETHLETVDVRLRNLETKH